MATTQSSSPFRSPQITARKKPAPADEGPTLDVVGIGNALVDVLAQATDADLEKLGLVKGTMTLVGCGLIWFVLFLLLLSYWYPPIRWLIAGLLIVFLGLQFLRYLIPKQKK